MQQPATLTYDGSIRAIVLHKRLTYDVLPGAGVISAGTSNIITNALNCSGPFAHIRLGIMVACVNQPGTLGITEAKFQTPRHSLSSFQLQCGKHRMFGFICKGSSVGGFLEYVSMKQVIVVNGSLGLPTGKLAAQVAHAAVGAFVAASAQAQVEWLQVGMPKIVVYAADAQVLMQLEQAAREQQIPACLVRDAGRTVVSTGTITCLGLGPAPPAIVDGLTGKLSLV
jgi:peptidyl-tRNA hydrolase